MAPAGAIQDRPGKLICGIRLVDWMASLYTVPFYPCEILTPATAATKNEAHVRATVRVKDLSNMYKSIVTVE